MIPSEFTIDGVPWTVTDCDTLNERWAETDKGDCKIRIGSDQCQSMKELAFWHELIHAIFSVRDFKIRSSDKPEDAEEEVATNLGPALHAFFLQNADIQWRYDPPEQ
jgi:hypothetical protein